MRRVLKWWHLNRIARFRSLRMRCLNVGTDQSWKNFLILKLNRDENLVNISSHRSLRCWNCCCVRQVDCGRLPTLDIFCALYIKMTILLLTRENSSYNSTLKEFTFNLDRQLEERVKHIRFQTFSFRPIPSRDSCLFQSALEPKLEGACVGA